MIMKIHKNLMCEWKSLTNVQPQRVNKKRIVLFLENTSRNSSAILNKFRRNPKADLVNAESKKNIAILRKI